jgi:predicted nucleic acid-binding protein
MENDSILIFAEKFVYMGIKAKDALYIASAIDGQSGYFITTDNRILGVANRIPEIKIISPLGFIEKEDQP